MVSQKTAQTVSLVISLVVISLVAAIIAVVVLGRLFFIFVNKIDTLQIYIKIPFYKRIKLQRRYYNNIILVLFLVFIICLNV